MQSSSIRKRKQLLLPEFSSKKQKVEDEQQHISKKSLKEQIESFGSQANLVYEPHYFSESDQKELISHLDNIDWQRVTYKARGTTIRTPRLTFCYGQLGEAQEEVRWKGKSFKTEPFPSWLQQICDRIQNESGLQFNACILNCYENESDSITWHVDAEKFLAHANVASISLGQHRTFKYRVNGKVHSVPLESGSLSILVNGLEHHVPKVPKQQLSKRYNITLRQVKGNEGLGNYYFYNRGEAYQIESSQS